MFFVQTVKTFLEETLDAIPDSVLDKPVNREPSSDEGYFANVDSLLPPKYTTPINCSCESLELVAASTWATGGLGVWVVVVGGVVVL